MSLVDDVRKQVETRLRELKPLVEEHEALHALIQRLSGGGGSGSKSSATPARRRGRPPGSKTRKRATRASSASRKSTAKAAPTAKAESTAKSASTTARKPARRRGRPKGGGTRAAQAQALVKAKPGVTIPELAKQMGIHQNYLYRVMPGLAKDRKIKRVGKGWHPVE